MKSIKQDIKSGVIIFLTIATLWVVTVFATSWYDTYTVSIGDGLTATKWNLLAKATVPTGAIIAFSGTCPSPEWTEYLPARGRFLRGLDNGAGNDPDCASRTGGCTIGSIQADAFQGHKHLGDYASNTSSTTPYHANLGNLAYYTKDAVQTGYGTDGTNGTPRIAIETRPKNVAVIFCIKQ